MQISLDKQYETKDGRPVRIYAVDGSKDWPIHGAVKTRYGWEHSVWDEYGNCGHSSIQDLNLVELHSLSDISVGELMEILPDDWDVRIFNTGFVAITDDFNDCVYEDYEPSLSNIEKICNDQSN